jgi:hypothetical protein
MARGVGDCCVATGERERERKADRGLPHHLVVLRGRPNDGGRQRSGGAAAGPSSSGKRRLGARV